MNVYIKSTTGGGYSNFWNCKKRYRVVKGGRASKKSCTLALYYIYNLMKYYHVYNVKPCLLVIRKFLNTHRNSTRAQLIWAINKLKVSHLWEVPKGELTLTYRPSGQTILFRGVDDIDSLTSITVPIGHLTWCWLEESFQIHNETDFNKIDMSFRGDLPDPLFKQMTLSFNPWNSLTWIKPRFFDKPDPDVFTLTTTYLDNEFLGVDDLKIFNKMKKQNPRRYSVEGMGNWGNCEGLIYLSYVDDPENNHIEKIPENEKLGFISIGLDYGSGQQDSKLGKTCLAAVGVSKDFKNVYAIKESYFNGFNLPEKIIEWVIDFILDIKNKYPKTDIQLNCEWASSSTINNALKLEINKRKIDVTILDAYKSTILDRVELCQILLGEKRLLFLPECQGIKSGFANALWDSSEKQKLKGVPARLDNGTSDIDILDCVEYALTRWTEYLLAASRKI